MRKLGIVSSIVGAVLAVSLVALVGFYGGVASSRNSTLHSTTTAIKKAKGFVTKSKIPDIRTLDYLMYSVVIPSGWGGSNSVSSVVLPSLVDNSCNVQTTEVPVKLNRSEVFSLLSDGKQSVTVQLMAYPAGLGAVAASYILNQAGSCSGVVVKKTDLGYATQSFEIDSANPKNFDSSVYVRVGDVLGVVTTINAPAVGLAAQWASSWYPNWSKILTVDVCPQQTSTIADSSRSPYSVNYVGGWNKREVVVLDKQRTVAADIAGHVLLLNATRGDVKSTVTVLPTSAETPVVAVPLTGYPTTLSVSLPSGEPGKPVVPIFPTEPNSLATSAYVVADPIGPGCGWAFTGETPPTLSNNATFVDSVNATFNAATKLVKARADWWVGRYDYVTALNEYMTAVTAWNIWVSSANVIIATALWKQYNSDVIAYQDASIIYAVTYAGWKRNCPAPFDASTCPNQPKAPVAPTVPPVPNPNP